MQELFTSMSCLAPNCRVSPPKNDQHAFVSPEWYSQLIWIRFQAVDIWDEFTLEFSDHFSVEIRGLDTPEVGGSTTGISGGRMDEVGGLWVRSGFQISVG